MTLHKLTIELADHELKRLRRVKEVWDRQEWDSGNWDSAAIILMTPIVANAAGVVTVIEGAATKSELQNAVANIMTNIQCPPMESLEI